MALSSDPLATRLERANRAKSGTALSSLRVMPLDDNIQGHGGPSARGQQQQQQPYGRPRAASLSASKTVSFIPRDRDDVETAGREGHGERAQGGRWPFNASYSSRGIEADPFEDDDSVRIANLRAASSPRSALRKAKSTLGGKKKDLAVDLDWSARLGATARVFGWSVEEEERIERWRAYSGSGDTEDDEDDYLQHQHSRQSHRPALPSKKSSLSVYHDAAESTPSSPTTARRSDSIISFMTSSVTGSPEARRTVELPSVGANRSRQVSANPDSTTLWQDEDLDAQAQAALAAQDKFGLFALVEKWLDWPALASSSSSSAKAAGADHQRHQSASSVVSATSWFAELASPLDLTPPLSRTPSELSLNGGTRSPGYFRQVKGLSPFTPLSPLSPKERHTRSTGHAADDDEEDFFQLHSRHGREDGEPLARSGSIASSLEDVAAWFEGGKLAGYYSRQEED